MAHWSALWPVLAVYLVVAGAHLAGTFRGGQSGRRAVIRQAALFQAGLLLALLAVVSPLRYWSGVHIWVRAIQDLVLAMVVPGLIVAGAPWWLRWPPATVAVLVRWRNDEESEELSAGIDRPLAQPSSAWPSRPRFR